MLQLFLGVFTIILASTGILPILGLIGLGFFAVGMHVWSKSQEPEAAIPLTTQNFEEFAEERERSSKAAFSHINKMKEERIQEQEEMKNNRAVYGQSLQNMWENKEALNFAMVKNNLFTARCRYCNQPLTQKHTVEAGMGEVCSKRSEMYNPALEEYEENEAKTLEYLTGPGLFKEQKIRAHVELVKESFGHFVKHRKDVFARTTASALNRMFADKDVQEELKSGTSGLAGEIAYAVNVINKKDDTALKFTLGGN